MSRTLGSKRRLQLVIGVVALMVTGWYLYERSQPTFFYMPDGMVSDYQPEDNEADYWYGYSHLGPNFTHLKYGIASCQVQYHWKGYRDLFYPLPPTLNFKDWCDHELVGPKIGPKPIAEK